VVESILAKYVRFARYLQAEDLETGPLTGGSWDRGEPEILAAEMARFSRSVHRTIWINPLASRPGFAPEARGMQANLPFVDDFIGVASLDDLQSLVQLLESVGAAPRSGAGREALAS